MTIFWIDINNNHFEKSWPKYQQQVIIHQQPIRKSQDPFGQIWKYMYKYLLQYWCISCIAWLQQNFEYVNTSIIMYRGNQAVILTFQAPNSIITEQADALALNVPDHQQAHVQCWLNTLRLRQNSRNFSDNIFKCIFLKENTIWLKFVPEGPIDNNSTLVQIMA